MWKDNPLIPPGTFSVSWFCCLAQILHLWVNGVRSVRAVGFGSLQIPHLISTLDSKKHVTTSKATDRLIWVNWRCLYMYLLVYIQSQRLPTIKVLCERDALGLIQIKVLRRQMVCKWIPGKLQRTSRKCWHLHEISLSIRKLVLHEHSLQSHPAAPPPQKKFSLQLHTGAKFLLSRETSSGPMKLKSTFQVIMTSYCRGKLCGYIETASQDIRNIKARSQMGPPMDTVPKHTSRFGNAFPKMHFGKVKVLEWPSQSVDPIQQTPSKGGPQDRPSCTISSSAAVLTSKAGDPHWTELLLVHWVKGSLGLLAFIVKELCQKPLDPNVSLHT